MAWPSLIARTKDWGTETLTDADLEGQFDLIVTYINDMMDSTSGHKHDATTAEGPKILVSNLNLTSGAAGDVVYHNGTNLVRLAIGTAAQVLKVNAGATAPEWGAGATAATQAEQETGSSTTVFVTPGRQHYHPSAAKVLAFFNGTSGSPITPGWSYGVSGTITKNSTGNYTVTFSTAFSSTSYVVVGTAYLDGSSRYCNVHPKTLNVGSCVFEVVDVVSDTVQDATNVSIAIFGDL